MSELNLKHELFGEKLDIPIVLLPVGLTGVYARCGEVQAAKAAANKGIPFTMSSVSVCNGANSIKGIIQSTLAQL